MFRRKPKTVLTDKQIKEQVRVERIKKESERELSAAIQFLLTFRPEKERNGFVEDFRKAIGDGSGH